MDGLTPTQRSAVRAAQVGARTAVKRGVAPSEVIWQVVREVGAGSVFPEQADIEELRAQLKEVAEGKREMSPTDLVLWAEGWFLSLRAS